MKTILAILLIALGAVLHAQIPTKPLTNAELRAKVAELEQQLARVEADYRIVLTACQGQSASSSPPPTAVAAPITSTVAADTAAADRLERATTAFQTAQILADNRLEQIRQQQRADDDSWVVKSVDYGVTETNSVFMRFGWKVAMKNGIGSTQAFDLTVQFLDKRDLVIDTARLYNQTIAAYSEREITGDKLVSMPGALSVASVKAIASRKK